MKGFMRSIYYWFYNLEKVFLAMVATIAVVLLFNLLMNDSAGILYLLEIYLPMIGGIFSVAVMMSAATNYIPQSLSLGGTRKEVFAGMECALHIVVCQTLLLAFLLNAVMPEPIFEQEYIIVSAVFYLIFAGISNATCAGGLKFGTRVAMIIYIIMVMVIATAAGMMSTFMSISDLSLNSVFKMAADYWIAEAVFDVLMAAVCYQMMRKYEVRI